MFYFIRKFKKPQHCHFDVEIFFIGWNVSVPMEKKVVKTDDNTHNKIYTLQNSTWQLHGKFFCISGKCFNISIQCLNAKKCGETSKGDAACLANNTYQEEKELTDIGRSSIAKNSTNCVAQLSPTNISIENLLANTRTSLFVLNATKMKGKDKNQSEGQNSGIIVIASSLPSEELAKAANQIKQFLSSKTMTWVPKSSGEKPAGSESRIQRTDSGQTFLNGLGKNSEKGAWVPQPSRGSNVDVESGRGKAGLKMMQRSTTMNTTKKSDRRGKLLKQDKFYTFH